MNNEILFSEKQNFKPIGLWVLMLGMNALFLCGFIGQVFLGSKWGKNPMSNTLLIIVTLSTFLPTILFYYMKLETEMKEDGIYVRFFPLQWRFQFYSWANLNKSFVRQYSPMGEFGGWGIRGLGKKKALNMSGDKGIQLVIKDGSQLLIGTRKPDEVTLILKQMGQLTE